MPNKSMSFYFIFYEQSISIYIWKCFIKKLAHDILKKNWFEIKKRKIIILNLSNEILSKLFIDVSLLSAITYYHIIPYRNQISLRIAITLSTSNNGICKKER